ncbi:MAG: hypothetical protein WCJ35_21970 [Planctomycetota bacterium]
MLVRYWRTQLARLWYEDEGVLTFEWITLYTLLVIGTIGGVAGVRDALNQECLGVIGAMTSLDQSYYVAPPLGIDVQSATMGKVNSHRISSASGSQFNSRAAWANGRTSSDLSGGIQIPLTLQP